MMTIDPVASMLYEVITGTSSGVIQYSRMAQTFVEIVYRVTIS